MKTINDCKNEAQIEETGKPFDVEWGGEFTRIVNVMERAMEIYAQQFKYDYSQECKCGEDSTGSTWCCNICGLPLTKKKEMFNLSEIQPLINALKVIKNWDDETEDEWEDPGYVADHALKNWNIK